MSRKPDNAAGHKAKLMVRKILAGHGLLAGCLALLLCAGCGAAADREASAPGRISDKNNGKTITAGEKKMAEFYDYTLNSRTGETVKMSDFKGKAVLIVNTATGLIFSSYSAGNLATKSESPVPVTESLLHITRSLS